MKRTGNSSGVHICLSNTVV
jgi:urate oxidase